MKSTISCLLASAAALLGSCHSTDATSTVPSRRYEGGITELEVQALVMQMADEYNAALGETTYLILMKGEVEPTARWLSLSFLRNGMGAMLDIAAGPNPDVALLDLLVVATLQTWAFEKHWVPAGISPESGTAALARLREAETALWETSRRVLSEKQEQSLHGLIDQWISEHGDQTVVAFVRFDEFTEERQLSTAGARQEASGLLREVGKASAAVEDARLFGERALWFASRYPYILGQQAELTTYRMLDQPEATRAREAVAQLGELSEGLASWLAERELFDRIREERIATVDHFFERVSGQREELVALLESTELDLSSKLSEVRETALVCAEAGRTLTETAEAANRVIAHFDRDLGDGREPLRLEELRIVATELNSAAERMTLLLDRVDAMGTSEGWEQGVAAVESATTGLANAFFLRGVGLVALFVAGLALLRLVPQRGR